MQRFFAVVVAVIITTCVSVNAFAGNQEVADMIAGKLSKHLPGAKIQVKCHNGVVWLRGEVSSQGHMNRALGLAHQTAGITRVVNELDVSQLGAGNLPLELMDGSLAPESVARQTSVAANVRTRNANVREIQPVETVVSNEPERRFSSSGTIVPASAQEPIPLSDGSGPVMAEMPEMDQPMMIESSVEPTLAQMPTPAPPRPRPIVRHSEPVEVVQHENARPQPQPIRQTAQQAMPQPQPVPAQYSVVQGPTSMPEGQMMGPAPMGVAPARYDQPCLPNHAWPSYAAYPNYAAVTYPKQYAPHAWPYIGPFYPYPQVPLGWRKVTLEWHDGWWFLDFDDGSSKSPFSGLFRPCR